MVVTIDIPESLIRKSELSGRSVAALIAEAVQQLDHVPNEWEIRRGPPTPGFKWLGVPTSSPEEAGAKIREIASRNTLGGLNIKDLINEGRRT